MRGMWLMPQCVQKQYVEPPQLFHRFRQNLAVIGQVRGAAETISKHLAAPMHQRHRMALQTIKIECRSVQCVSFQFRNGRLRRAWIENIVKRSTDRVERIFRPKDGYRSL